MQPLVGKKVYPKKMRWRFYLVYIAIVIVVAVVVFYMTKNMYQTRESEIPDIAKNASGKSSQRVNEFPKKEKIIKETAPQEHEGENNIAKNREYAGKTADDVQSEIASYSHKDDDNTPTSSGMVIFTMASDYYLKKDYNKAIELYKLALPHNKMAAVYIGLCYYWRKDYINAVTYFEQALQFNKVDFIAKKYVALSYYNLNDLERARKLMEEALLLMDDNELKELQTMLLEERKVMDGYSDLSGVKFKILFSKEKTLSAERTVLDILNEAYRTIGGRLDLYPSQPITVILYNEKDFFDITRSPGWAGGLYDGKIRLPIKGMEEQKQILTRILFHEYVHALVHTITPKCPLWINEGLAQYFSEIDMEKIGQVIPLQTLEDSFPGDTEQVIIAYVESYSAVSYLIDRYSIYRMKELLYAIGKTGDVKTAFESALFISYDSFLKTWEKD
ncbi:MAG: hypothetical protein A2Y62_07160 [Candidatus Fischerbacteria bacterium RBG_13_37_8]|uniref:Peptidase MA-like domain-containing protein n=1 Tax=Candidatus Fischerbacteria bacterium RBG_13_37_8 TaxID=1817863 RepID=A0A1F5VV20_9BACT|nr:MAG: hypothetical protein A2Y62_07160 [Candidatus Fischerbacteria bacterium RBG_13_37_8]